MPSQFIIFSFSILGIVLFIVRFQKVKKYFSTYAEIFGIVAIIYVLNILIGHFVFNLELDIGVLLIAIISFIRNTLLASLATFYFYNKLNLSIAPFFISSEKEKYNLTKRIKFSIITLLAIIFVALFFILLSGNQLIDIRDVSFDVGIYTVLNSFLISFNEEIFVRLFMFGTIAYWLRKIRGNFVVAAILSSLLWSLDHFLVDVMMMKFLFLFIMGLLLSNLMYKKGIESCIVVHGLYNILAFLVLGYMN